MNPEQIRKFNKLVEEVNRLSDIIYRVFKIDKVYIDKPLVLRNGIIKLEGDNGLKIGENSTDKIGFYGATPVDQAIAPTTALDDITHTSPSTPDYALQDLVDSGSGSAFGFATKDEGNTVLSVILNLQTRVSELETILADLGITA